MRKKIITLLLLTFATLSISETINYKDITYVEGFKSGRTLFYYKDKNLSGVHTIVMDKPIRYKTDEYSYIINKLEGTFTDGSLDKEVKVYKDDQLVGEIFYVYGTKKSFKYYFPNGVISETLEKSTYRKYNDKGVLVIENLYGEYIKKYNDKGVLIIEDLYGKYLKEYYDNGNLKLSKTFKKSGENGITLDYYENGALKSSRTFKDGLLNGESTFYNEDGTILKKEIYSKGMKK